MQKDQLSKKTFQFDNYEWLLHVLIVECLHGRFVGVGTQASEDCYGLRWNHMYRL